MVERTWRTRARTLLEIVLSLGIATDYLALLLLGSTPAGQDPLGSVPNLALATTLSSMLLLVLLALLLALRRENPAPFFLGHRRDAGREVWRGILLVPAIFAVILLLKSGFRHLLPWLYSGERNLLEELVRTPGDLALFLFVALFSGGIREEIQRAFVVRRFEEGWGPPWLGALLYAVFFGWGHRIQGRDEAIIAGLLGFAWGVMFARRGSVIGPAVSHGLYDVAELIRYYAFGPLSYF